MLQKIYNNTNKHINKINTNLNLLLKIKNNNLLPTFIKNSYIKSLDNKIQYGGNNKIFISTLIELVNDIIYDDNKNIDIIFVNFNNNKNKIDEMIEKNNDIEFKNKYDLINYDFIIDQNIFKKLKMTYENTLQDNMIYFKKNSQIINDFNNKELYEPILQYYNNQIILNLQNILNLLKINNFFLSDNINSSITVYINSLINNVINNDKIKNDNDLQQYINTNIQNNQNLYINKDMNLLKTNYDIFKNKYDNIKLEFNEEKNRYIKNLNRIIEEYIQKQDFITKIYFIKIKFNSIMQKIQKQNNEKELQYTNGIKVFDNIQNKIKEQIIDLEDQQYMEEIKRLKEKLKKLNLTEHNEIIKNMN